MKKYNERTTATTGRILYIALAYAIITLAATLSNRLNAQNPEDYHQDWTRTEMVDKWGEGIGEYAWIHIGPAEMSNSATIGSEASFKIQFHPGQYGNTEDTVLFQILEYNNSWANFRNGAQIDFKHQGKVKTVRLMGASDWCGIQLSSRKARDFQAYLRSQTEEHTIFLYELNYDGSRGSEYKLTISPFAWGSQN